uniref:Uncharacterized protein n=1 Tax=Megaselia scalaris TaxID=36166 RepID=T1H1L5_MEGSC
MCGGVDFTNSGSLTGFNQMANDITSLLNFPTYSDEDIPGKPFDLTNTARSVYDGETFDRVKSVFVTSWKILQETMDLNSIFNPMLKVSAEMMHSSSTTTITSLSSAKVLPITKTQSLTSSSVAAQSSEGATSITFAAKMSDTTIL